MIDSIEDGEHNDVGFLEISNIFAKQDEFLDGSIPHDIVKTVKCYSGGVKIDLIQSIN